MRKCLAWFFFSLLAMSSAVYAEGQGWYNQGLELKSGLEHTFKSGFKDHETEVSLTRYGVQADYSFFTLGYEYSHYSWNDPGDAGIAENGDNPWDGLNNIYLAADVLFPLRDDWSLNVAAGISSSFEKEVSRSFGGSARIIFRRAFDNGWTAGIGAVGVYHPVRSIFIPAVGLAYAKPAGEGWSARIGVPVTMVRYGLNQDFALQAGANYSARIYRLEDRSPVSEKGYFRERSVRLGVQAEWNPADNMILQAGPYYMVARKWQIFDRRDNRLNSMDLKSAPGMEASLTWRF